MAAKRRKKRSKKSGHKGHKPSAKAKAAYHRNIVNSFKRTAPIVARYEPGVFTSTINSASKKMK